MLTIDFEGIMKFELAGRFFAKYGKKVEKILKRKVARAVARKHFEDTITEWILLNTQRNNANKTRVITCKRQQNRYLTVCVKGRATDLSERAAPKNRHCGNAE